jgi:hypothetical protein
MKIEQAIEILQQRKEEGVKSIVFAFWEADKFERKDDEKWESDTEEIEDNFDWSDTHERLSFQLWDAENQ